MKTALVVGATGITGNRICEHLLAEKGWNVVGLSRKSGIRPNIRWISVDLFNPTECREKLGSLKDVTHIFYAARHEFGDGIPESVEVNVGMLVNVVETIDAATKLQHVHVVHGHKYYDLSLPFLDENSPLNSQYNFFFPQEDFLRSRSGQSGWDYTISRPHLLCDPATNHRRMIGLIIAIYGMIQKELGLPFDFPGTEQGFHVKMPFTETGVLARAILWMAQEPKCAGQAFNIITDDCVSFADLWPHFAEYFGLVLGTARDFSLADYMSDKESLWDQILRRKEISPVKLEEIAMWEYGDRRFRQTHDLESTMAKAHKFGFQETLMSRDMFLKHFSSYFSSSGSNPALGARA